VRYRDIKITETLSAESTDRLLSVLNNSYNKYNIFITITPHAAVRIDSRLPNFTDEDAIKLMTIAMVEFLGSTRGEVEDRKIELVYRSMVWDKQNEQRGIRDIDITNRDQILQDPDRNRRTVFKPAALRPGNLASPMGVIQDNSRLELKVAYKLYYPQFQYLPVTEVIRGPLEIGINTVIVGRSVQGEGNPSNVFVDRIDLGKYPGINDYIRAKNIGRKMPGAAAGGRIDRNEPVYVTRPNRFRPSIFEIINKILERAVESVTSLESGLNTERGKLQSREYRRTPDEVRLLNYRIRQQELYLARAQKIKNEIIDILTKKGVVDAKNAVDLKNLQNLEVDREYQPQRLGRGRVGITDHEYKFDDFFSPDYLKLRDDYNQKREQVNRAWRNGGRGDPQARQLSDDFKNWAKTNVFDRLLPVAKQIADLQAKPAQDVANYIKGNPYRSQADIDAARQAAKARLAQQQAADAAAEQAETQKQNQLAARQRLEKDFRDYADPDYEKQDHFDLMKQELEELLPYQADPATAQEIAKLQGAMAQWRIINPNLAENSDSLYLGPTEKVAATGPILGAPPKKQRTLMNKFFGGS
jgi:hypothetical protein